MILPQFAPHLNISYTIILSNQLNKGIMVKNYINEKFGKWTLIEFKGRNKKSEQIYLCRCECGNLREHRLSVLKSGLTTQCKDCYIKFLNERENLTGKQFGYWSVLEKFKDLVRNEWFYKCECKCGTKRNIPAYQLKHGETTKCHRCRVKTHGMTYTSTFKIWRDMLARCLNPNLKSFKYYGGRGIGVCDRWRYSFENFLGDMGIRPEKLSLDRINNDGNYEPSNCRWATSKEQSNNKRRPIIKRKDK